MKITVHRERQLFFLPQKSPFTPNESSTEVDLSKSLELCVTEIIQLHGLLCRRGALISVTARWILLLINFVRPRTPFRRLTVSLRHELTYTHE